MTVCITRRPDDEVATELKASRGPLAGARLAVKDNVNVAGLPTTAACPEFAYTPDRDAAAVAALRAAGAVVVGKTNLDQFATGLVGTRSPYGAVPDIRRREYISGGSSSGSAVAVAKGEADIAVGTDTAGSGRVPAGLQGIVGIKPTVGVISTDGVVRASESYDCVTIFAPFLEPANRAMAVMAAGASGRAWPADVRLAAPPNPVVAVPSELPELDRDWRAAFDAAVDVLVEAGARIVTVDMGIYTNFCNLFDLCAVAVPAGTAAQAQFGITVLARAFADAVALDIAALATGSQAPLDVWPPAAAGPVELVVFGAHMRGGPLVHQLTELGARWAGEITTAPRYRMSVLPTTPAKPAVTRVPDGAPGTALLGHRWQLSPAALGRFLAGLPAPMQLGKVEFDDGTWRTAFGCDASAPTGADISAYGSWPAAIATGAV